MHIVNCNNNGQVYERFLKSGTCSWNLALVAVCSWAGIQQRVRGSETAAISFAVCAISDSPETQVHQRNIYKSHPSSCQARDWSHLWDVKKKMGKVRFTLRTVKGKIWRSPKLLKIKLPVIFLIVINYLLISTLFDTKGRSWASFLLDIVVSSM